MKPKYWAIIILAAIATGTSAVYYVKQPVQDLGPAVVHRETKSDSSTVEALKDWKTYTNSKYGFEVQYPSNWKIAGIGDSDGVGENLSFGLSIWPNKSFYQSSPGEDLEIDPEGTSFQSFSPTSIPTSICNQDSFFASKEAIVCEEKSEKYIRIKADVNQNWSKNNLIYYNVDFENPDNQKVVNVYKQILSTFKFTSPGVRYLSADERLDYKTPWNFDPPNTTVTYSNPAKGFSFDVPFNEKWGNDQIKLKPHEETQDGKVYFGNLNTGCEGMCTMGRGMYVFAEKYQSAQSIIDDLKKPNGNFDYFDMKPEIKFLNSLQVVEYTYGELGTQDYLIVIGKKFNYMFIGGINDNSNMKNLEDTAKTLKFIN